MISSGYPSLSEKKEVDPFKGLKKVKDPNPGKSLPDGYVTDGYGNVYQVPKTGYSKEFKYEGITFRYNYAKNQIEALVDGKVFTAQGLSEGNWFDGPEYWVEKFYDEIEEEVKAELKTVV